MRTEKGLLEGLADSITEFGSPMLEMVLNVEGAGAFLPLPGGGA